MPLFFELHNLRLKKLCCHVLSILPRLSYHFLLNHFFNILIRIQVRYKSQIYFFINLLTIYANANRAVAPDTISKLVFLNRLFSLSLKLF